MSEGIAYQNKDILFKILGQTYKEKSFATYGIDLPPIRELLPTNLPKISANEVDLAEQIPDEEQRIFALSGVIVASDKFIDRTYLEQIRRRIHMTQLGQLYEKEKIEYGNQKAREASIKEKTEMALKMLNRNINIIDIMEVTGLTETEILRLQKTYCYNPTTNPVPEKLSGTELFYCALPISRLIPSISISAQLSADSTP